MGQLDILALGSAHPSISVPCCAGLYLELTLDLCVAPDGDVQSRHFSHGLVGDITISVCCNHRITSSYTEDHKGHAWTMNYTEWTSWAPALPQPYIWMF